MSDETSAAIAREALERAKMKLIAYIGVCKGDKELTDAVLPIVSDAIAALDAGRAAASSDLDAIKREAAREALTRLAGDVLAESGNHARRSGSWSGSASAREIAVWRDYEYPAPAPAPVPEPPHEMVNGWRVTWDGEAFVVSKEGREPRVYVSAVTLCSVFSPRTNLDSEVMRVLALREGRGDGHAQA